MVSGDGLAVFCPSFMLRGSSKIASNADRPNKSCEMNASQHASIKIKHAVVRIRGGLPPSVLQKQNGFDLCKTAGVPAHEVERGKQSFVTALASARTFDLQIILPSDSFT